MMDLYRKTLSNMKCQCCGSKLIVSDDYSVSCSGKDMKLRGFVVNPYPHYNRDTKYYVDGPGDWSIAEDGEWSKDSLPSKSFDTEEEAVHHATVIRPWWEFCK
jgi:hypothetical protein